jgi:hypothetical protein
VLGRRHEHQQDILDAMQKLPGYVDNNLSRACRYPEVWF